MLRERQRRDTLAGLAELTLFRGILVPVQRSHTIVLYAYSTPVPISEREFRRRHALHRRERVVQKGLFGGQRGDRRRVRGQTLI